MFRYDPQKLSHFSVPRTYYLELAVVLAAEKRVRSLCHSRASGNAEPHAERLDSRLRGNDGQTTALMKRPQGAK
jgi:hypothetical protein